jgi:hypothetical protein
VTHHTNATASGTRGRDVRDWQPIETAPKDGSELLGYREDCGVLLMRWTCLGEFLTDAELEPYSEAATYAEDWFYADFISGGRLEGQETPTHWMPLPASPSSTHRGQAGEGE